MKFKYEINSNNNEVSLVGIEGKCPKELYIPEYLYIEGKQIKITEINFGSPLPLFYTEYGNGVTSEVIHIPETVNCVSFGYNKYLKEVFLPNSLRKIGNACFTHCEKLEIVHLPNGLESIGWYAFRDCCSLVEIFIPPTVYKMDFGCFKNCSSLKRIIIPNGVEELGIHFFHNCINLREVITLNPNINFYPTTFQGCKSLSKIDNHLVENGLLYNLDKTELYTYLGNDNCNGCITIPASVRELGNGFASSTELISIDLSKTQIEAIYYDTFKNSVNLKRVILPPTIKSIDNNAFCGCINLSEINLPDSIERIGNSCFENSGIKEITLPESLEKIPDNAFKDCKELLEVVIPSNVKTIYHSAFENCDKIWHVVISEGFREKLPQLFKNHEKIGFSIRIQGRTNFKRRGAYTHGRLRPCPYCGSDDVNIFSNGTAECNTCDGEYTYQ